VPASDFELAVAPYRAELHGYCYRMLGSVHDADDALQDALLRAWRAFDRFEGRSSLRAWLYRIATNVSLDLIARRPKRMLPLGSSTPRCSPASGCRPRSTERRRANSADWAQALAPSCRRWGIRAAPSPGRLDSLQSEQRDVVLA
jgi:RNA polymerase sigma factor (sigma-70 family)